MKKARDRGDYEAGNDLPYDLPVVAHDGVIIPSIAELAQDTAPNLTQGSAIAKLILAFSKGHSLEESLQLAGLPPSFMPNTEQTNLMLEAREAQAILSTIDLSFVQLEYLQLYLHLKKIGKLRDAMNALDKFTTVAMLRAPKDKDNLPGQDSVPSFIKNAPARLSVSGSGDPLSK
jgi:hypothetical protein